MRRKNEGSTEGLPGRLPSGKRTGSMLADETRTMAREQRQIEQEGHRRLAKVHARERPEEDSQQNAPEGELQNHLAQHPNLNSQRFDGIDSPLNPEPPLNSEARREYDNQRREQEKEKQERLENVLGLGKAPKASPRPRGPG